MCQLRDTINEYQPIFYQQTRRGYNVFHDEICFVRFNHGRDYKDHSFSLVNNKKLNYLKMNYRFEKIECHLGNVT